MDEKDKFVNAFVDSVVKAKFQPFLKDIDSMIEKCNKAQKIIQEILSKYTTN